MTIFCLVSARCSTSGVLCRKWWEAGCEVLHGFRIRISSSPEDTPHLLKGFLLSTFIKFKAPWDEKVIFLRMLLCTRALASGGKVSHPSKKRGMTSESVSNLASGLSLCTWSFAVELKWNHKLTRSKWCCWWVVLCSVLA